MTIKQFNAKYPSMDFGDIHINRPCQINSEKKVIVAEWGWQIYLSDEQRKRNGMRIEEVQELTKNLRKALKFCKSHP